MNINSVGSTTYDQMFQSTAEKSGGQTVRQQAGPPQGPVAENKESVSTPRSEAVQNTEGVGSRSLDIYS